MKRYIIINEGQLWVGRADDADNDDNSLK